MSNIPLTDTQVAEIFSLDLWNEHHYQITATTKFYEVLRRNSSEGKKEGDEPALSSALIHTRSLLEFYDPALERRHGDSVWWVTGAGSSTDNRSWQALSGKPWNRVVKWVQPIHTYLGHLSVARRTLTLPEPEDKFGQRWPLLRFVRSSFQLLDGYVQLIRREGQRGSAVIAALEEVQQNVKELQEARPAWLTDFDW